MKRPQALRVYLISWLTDFAYMLFIFAITRSMAQHGSTLPQLGIVGGATSFSYGIGGSLAGHLSDRWGRRRLVTLGAITQAMVYFTSSLWQSQLAFYLLAGLAGLTAGMIFPPIIAWLTEGNHHAHQRNGALRTLFRFCLAWNLGLVCGQTAGGWLFPISQTLPIIISTLLMMTVLALALGWPPAPETEAEGPEPEQFSSPVPLAQARTFVYLGWTANVAGALAMSMIFYLFPYLAERHGISPPIHGMMLATNRLTVILTYVLMYYLTFWQYRLSTTLVAQACAMVGLFFLIVGTTAPVLTVGLVLVAVLLGYIYFSSIFYSTTGFADHQKGMASGMHEASLALGFGVGALGGGLVGGWLGPRTPYLACLIVLAVSAILQVGIYLGVRRRWAPAQ